MEGLSSNLKSDNVNDLVMTSAKIEYNDFCFEYSKEYTHKNSYSMALLASLAYEKEDKIKDIADALKMEAKILNSGVNRCILFTDTHNKIQFIVFKGTTITNPVEVLQDLSFALVKEKFFSNIFFHKGFLTGYLLLRKKIHKHQKKGYKTVFTGHSLGAALAILASFHQKEESVTYTFGQPRAGNWSFARTFDKKKKHYYFRVVNSSRTDVVTQVPPKTAFLPVNSIPAYTFYDHSHKDFYQYKENLFSKEKYGLLSTYSPEFNENALNEKIENELSEDFESELNENIVFFESITEDEESLISLMIDETQMSSEEYSKVLSEMSAEIDGDILYKNNKNVTDWTHSISVYIERIKKHI